MVHMNILITCVFAAFLMGALLAGLIVFCYRDSFLRKPRHVHKDAESAPSCSDSTGSFVKLNGLFDSPVKVSYAHSQHLSGQKSQGVKLALIWCF